MAGQSDPTADLARANAARVHDWLLGGSFNTPIDRVVAAQIESIWPSLRQILRASRAFLGLAVEHMLERGVRQFVELGAGLPMSGHVHHLVRDQDEATVVYVDKDPVVAAHGDSALRGIPGTAYIQADIAAPQEVLAHEATRRLIDFERPVGVLMIEILHLLPDQARPGSLVNSYRECLCAGSGIALSHVTSEWAPQIELLNTVHGDLLGRATPRDRPDLIPWISGLSLVEPGLASLSDWPLPHGEDHGQTEPLRNTLAAIGYTP
ncbi:SAM-dependent methyltransferase [Nocardia sp. NRRL S-836]|uniref:SAM-dependent methyltransferase n=1 Tax=Nocardia sp. NRRL S-836 TaxID=1519492 RepID=UPI000A6CAE01|nr:SAM-dependent methyltransferase [Nocardia sp. NRRL S-836]